MKVKTKTYVNIRKSPNRDIRETGILNPNVELEVEGTVPGENVKELVNGEEIESSIWYKDAAGHFYWGGGIEALIEVQESSLFKYNATKIAPWSKLNFEVSRFWEYTTGKNITIAVLDSGIYRHVDLSDAIDYKFEKSFVPGTVEDTDGHGTHVAGIIAARGKSDLLGVAPDAKILPLRIVEDSAENINTKILIEAIEYATSLDHVNIINLSLNSNSNDTENETVLKEAIQKAISANKIVVAASGNFGWNFLLPPANINSMISVACIEIEKLSVNESYKLRYDSNYGTNLSTCCPGSNIKSCAKDTTGSILKSGTSMACAYLSGLIALKLQLKNSTSANSQLNISQVIRTSVFQVIRKESFILPIINPSVFINS